MNAKSEFRQTLEKQMSEYISSLSDPDLAHLIEGSYELSVVQIKATCARCRDFFSGSPQLAIENCSAGIIDNCPLDAKDALTFGRKEWVKKIKLATCENFNVEEMKDIKDGEKFVQGGKIHTADGDAHLLGDAKYDDQYVVYSKTGDSFFEEDFPSQIKAEGSQNGI